MCSESKQFKISHCYPYVRAVAKTALMYLIYVFMHFTAQIQLEPVFFEHQGTALYLGILILENILELILSFLILNTVLLTFSIYSKKDRIAFLENRTEGYNPQTERKNLLHAPHFLTETITLIALMFLVPAADNITVLLSMLPGVGIPHPLMIRLTHGCLCGICAFFINIHAHTNAQIRWLTPPDQASKKTIWKPIRDKQDKAYSYVRMALRLVCYYLIYSAAAVAIPTFVFYIKSTIMILFLLIAPVTVVVLFELILALNYLHALKKRHDFFNELKKICKQDNFEIREINTPYLSIFRETENYTFSVCANGTTYYCRVISCINRGKPMIFDEKGILRRVKIFRMISEVDYTFEAPGKKLLILNPPAKFVKISIQGKLRDADNGDRVGEYTIYSSGSFLRSLDRNAIQ